MRIGFLHQPNDIYTPVRMKYFISKGYQVYSISFPKKKKQENIEGLNRIFLPELYLNRIPFVKRLIYGWHILKITRSYKLDILHIISALNVFYLFCSKAEKNVLENEGSDVLLTPKKYPALRGFYYLFYKFADAIVQDSKVSHEASKKYYHMVKSKPNEVIEIGIDFKIFNKYVEKGIAREKLKISNGPFIFHSRGLSAIYNIETIIKSISLVKENYHDSKFVFTGEKRELNGEIIQYIDANKLNDNVIFCGRLDHEKEIKYFYRDSDVVISIPLSDSSPFSVYESIACQTPCIVSDLPWFKDKFIPDKHLLTIPVKDYKSLGEKIIKVLSGKCELDLESAYKIVLENIDMEKENHKLELLYQNLLANSKS